MECLIAIVRSVYKYKNVVINNVLIWYFSCEFIRPCKTDTIRKTIKKYVTVDENPVSVIRISRTLNKTSKCLPSIMLLVYDISTFICLCPVD